MKLIITTLLIISMGFFGTLSAQQDLNLIGSHLDYWGKITGVHLIDRTAYISTQNLGLLIYDLEDITSPVRLSRSRQFRLSHLGEWNGYLTGLTGRHLVFIDVSNPQEPQLAGSIEASNVVSYSFSDTLCFISTYRFYSYGVGNGYIRWTSFTIFNISDLQEPSRRYLMEQCSDSADFIDVGFSQMAYNQGILYTANNGDGSTRAWDTRNADTLVLASELNPYGSQGLLIQDEHLLNIKNRSITMYGLGDPSSPDSLSSIWFDLSSDCLIQDTLLYRMTYADSTLRILDISNFEEPEQIGTMVLSSSSSGGLVVSDNTAIIRTNNSTFAQLIDLSNLAEPEGDSILGEPRSITRIWKYGDLLFSSVDYQGLIISDCSDRVRPVEVATLPHAMVTSVVMRDRFAFVTEYREGVFIYFLGEPTEPEQMAVVNAQLLGHYDADIFGNALYIAGWNGIKVYDISNVSSPRYVSTISNEACMELQIIDTLLIARDALTASIYSIASPFAPRKIMPYSPDDEPEYRTTDILAIDRTLFVFGICSPWEDEYYPILDVVDISRPDSARMIRSYYYSEFASHPGIPLNINGRLGMVFQDALYIYSLHEFHHYGPNVYASYRLQPYSPGSAIFDDDFLYVSTPGAIDIYDSSLLGVKAEDHPTPSAFSLSAFPNPFNSSVTISFTVGAQGLAPLRLAIYDLSGRLVADLTAADLPRSAGKHKVIWDAGDMANGIYWVRLQSQESFKAIKIVLIK